MAGALPETATAEEEAEHGKLMNRLKRMTTPADVAKALREHDRMLSRGEVKRALPKDATPEQVAEYRKAHGIPEAADKYDLGLPKDVELTDLDRKMLDGWTAKAHATNATPEQVKAGVEAYMDMRTAVDEQAAEADAKARDATIEELRSEWGVDYRNNTGGVTSMLNQCDSEAREAILAATMPGGVKLVHQAPVMRALAAQARMLGFAGGITLPSGQDAGKTVDDEIAGIEKSMFNEDGTKNPDYWKNSKAQSRYSELLQAKERLKK